MQRCYVYTQELKHFLSFLGYSTGSIKSCVDKIISSDTFRTASNEEIEGNFLTEIKAAKLVTTKDEAYRKFSVDCMKEEKSVLIKKENL